MQSLFKSVCSLGRLTLVPLGVLAWIALAPASALAQPTNDNFINAAILPPVGNGSVAGDNLGATAEPNEVLWTTLAVPVTGGASVWYTWTAPASGGVTFDTEGSDFDTLLGVYTGTDLTNLLVVGENNDISATDTNSSVMFTAQAGVTYFIAVDGVDFGTGPSQGHLVLNWSSSGLSAGKFQFTSPYYLYSGYEYTFPVVSPTPMKGTFGGRITVTRLLGTQGRVRVGYTLTSGIYTNYEAYGWRGVFGVINDPNTGGTTNFDYEVLVVTNYYGDYISGQYVYRAVTNFATYAYTNENGIDIGPFITFSNNVSGPDIPVFPCLNTTTTPDPITVLTYFCTNWITTNLTYASPSFLNVTNGTLVFDDFQMSRDILVTNSGFGPFEPVGTNYVIANELIIATLTNAWLDPLESPAIAPPILSGTNPTAQVFFGNQDVIPGEFFNVSGSANLAGMFLTLVTGGSGQYGTNVVNFERATIRCDRDVGRAGIWVVRGGILDGKGFSVPYHIDHARHNRPNQDYNYFRMQTWDVLLQAGSDYAIPPDPDWYGTPPDFGTNGLAGTIDFPANSPDPVFLPIPVYDYGDVQFNKDFLVQLYYPPGSTRPTDWLLGYQQTAVVTILFGPAPAGSIDRTYNPDNNSGTTPPYNPNPGANDVVYAVAAQPDGKAILAGSFTAYNTTPRNRIVRANANGMIDLTFDPLDGADSFVSALALDASGRIVAGGAFTSFNRIPRNRIARLNSDGSLDTSFFPGLGADGTIWSISLHTNGTMLIAGEFTFFNGTNRNYIARLNSDGSLDTSFDPGVGPDNFVQAVAVQPDGRVLIGGDFTSVAGATRNYVARLNPDGSLDNTFDPEGLGADGNVYAVTVQPDGHVLIGGAFQTVVNVNRNGIARLNPDGSLDQTFDPGRGADDIVYRIALQPDGAIVLGGLFASYNQTRRVGLARIFSYGVLDTSFMDTGYNQFAGLINHYWDITVEPRNFIFDMSIQPDGNILVVGSFSRIGGGFSRTDAHVAHYSSRIVGGATPGPGNIEFAASNYTGDQAYDTNGAPSFITLTRNNGFLGPAAVNVGVNTNDIGPGAAVDGVDFSFNSQTFGHPTWLSSYFRPSTARTWQLRDGTFGQNQGGTPTVNPNSAWDYTANDLKVTILNNTNAVENRTFNLALSDPGAQDQFQLGGENIPLGVAVGRQQAPFLIVQHNSTPGVLGFSMPTFIVNEGGTNAIVTVVRTNGSTGPVSVLYATADGFPTNGIGAATNGIHYKATSGRLSFNPGQLTNTFKVQLIDEGVVEHDHAFRLNLWGTTGGAGLGLTNATVLIRDNDIAGGYVEFDSPSYGVNEDGGFALLSVTRNGSSAGTLTVQLTTTNGTAIARTNYTAVATNLVWNNGEVQPKVVAVPILDDGLVQTNPLSFNVRLSNPTFNGSNSVLALGNFSNAVVYITNRDFVGQLAWSTPTYLVNENGGYAVATVVRTGGSAGPVSVNFATSDGTAVNNQNYRATNGTLFFGPGEVSRSFIVPLLDDGVDDLLNPFFFTLTLSSPVPAGILATQTVAIVSILDSSLNNQPPGEVDTSLDPAFGVDDVVHALWLQADGKLLAGGDFTHANGLPRNRLARFAPNGSLDTKFSSAAPTAGPNGSVRALLAQTDERILIGGDFTQVNGVNRNYLARLNLDASLDSSFNPGSGPDSTVYAVAETFVGSARKLLLGGSFLNFNSFSRPNVARINDNGSLDAAFNPGAGPNGAVLALAVQPDGKIVIGGDFTTVNGLGRNHIARLNQDGSLDLGFDPGAGANDSVQAIALQLDGRILIGGLFTNVNGITLNHVARLGNRGGVDSTFSPGLGLDDAVLSITVQPDTRIILGGQFALCNGVTRNRLTRLNNDGTVDTMINFGSGADSFVAATLFQATNNLILFGGGFTHYDGHATPHLARIYGGTLAGSGTFEFTAANYQTVETATNTLVAVRRRGGTSGAPTGDVFVTCATSDGTARAGTNYFAVNTNLAFPPGEVLQTVTIPILHDLVITPNLTVNLALSNPQPPGGPGLGNQPIALLTIVNVESGISFSNASYATPQNPLTGSALITLQRVGSTNDPASVTFLTTTNGTAIPGLDYTPVTNNLLVFQPGISSLNAEVPILNNPGMLNDATISLVLSNANNAFLFSPYNATLTIVTTNRFPGQFLFSQTNYVVSEAGAEIALTVLRTNGHAGVATVTYATVPGSAVPGYKYVATNGVLSFADGETSKTIRVGILEEDQVEGNTTFSVALSNPTSGATLANPGTATVTIADDDIGIGFSSPVYVVNEIAGGITVTLNRIGTNGVTTVSYATTNGTALAGTNYQPAVVTLVFTNGEFLKTFSIPILHDPRVTGDLAFGVNLFDVSNNPPAPVQIFGQNPATVTILDADPGIAFTNSTFGVLKSGTNVLISVLRSNANTGVVSVNYATSNDTAVASVDYLPTSGQLTFSNGVVLQEFTVPIINNPSVEGDRAFNINLFNPSAGAQLLPPRIASVTITDDVSGLTFSSAAYSQNENAVSATITVLRARYTNSAVSVAYAVTNAVATNGLPAPGAAVPYVNYLPGSGTLVFTNGETVKTFSVNVLDDNVLSGDHTVQISLASPTGNAVVAPIPSSTLTIVETDGSLIKPAGVALLSESGPVNGAIDPGETVTLLFALRNATGTNTANLVATLLATNGVVNPHGATSAWPPTTNYGVLKVHGPSVSRAFTFTASGTNGQTILPTFQLRDGATGLSNAVFTFALGAVTNSFANPATILINDATNAAPYPSVITLNGIGNQVSKLSVSLTNLTHRSPQDIDILLVSPSGQKTYLMAKCGGFNSISNVILNFDDAAATSLTSGPIVSGSYRPSSLVAALGFPSPAPPPPYNTNLSIFSGSDPNGDWSLYVIDDLPFFSGIISNGWSLNLATVGLVPANADVGVAMTASPTTVVATSNVTFTVTITNYGPAGAIGIVVTDTLPAGTTFVSATPSLGAAGTNNAGLLIWTVSSLATNTGAKLDVVVRTGGAGIISDTAVVVTSGLDLNPDNASATASVTVVTPTADLGLALANTPNPVLPGSNVTVSVTLSNNGPATALAVGLTNTIPSALRFVSASIAGWTTNGSLLTFTNLGNLDAGKQTNFSFVLATTVAGLFTNKATCASAFLDPLKANNTANAIISVVTPSADLALGLVGLPNPLLLGNNLTYTISLTNLGPLTAPSLTVTNTLPPAVTLISASPGGWTLNGSLLTFTNLGNLAPSGQTNLTIVVKPTATGTLTNSAACAAAIFDPNLANNSAAVKTVVELLQLAVARSGNNIVISWPADAAGYGLEGATNLRPPVSWSPVTNPPTLVVDGQNTVTIPIGSGSSYYRLHQLP